MSDFNKALNSATDPESERKDRIASGSSGGVDHYAPHGESLFLGERGKGRRPRSRILMRTPACSYHRATLWLSYEEARIIQARHSRRAPEEERDATFLCSGSRYGRCHARSLRLYDALLG